MIGFLLLEENIMTDFTFHTIDSAPENSKPLLKQAKESFGFDLNLFAGMAESPALLEGYLALSEIFNKTRLSDIERLIIIMTNNRLNGCEYCIAAHTTGAKGQNIQAEVIEALRYGTPLSDQKLEALRVFTAKMIISRGRPEQKDLNAFLASGYTKENVFDVILGTGLKLMSNYANHIMDTPLDDAFKANAWINKKTKE